MSVYRTTDPLVSYFCPKMYTPVNPNFTISLHGHDECWQTETLYLSANTRQNTHEMAFSSISNCCQLIFYQDAIRLSSRCFYDKNCKSNIMTGTLSQRHMDSLMRCENTLYIKTTMTSVLPYIIGTCSYH